MFVAIVFCSDVLMMKFRISRKLFRNSFSSAADSLIVCYLHWHMGWTYQ